MTRFSSVRALLGCAIALGTTVPALADGPVSVLLGGQYITQGTARETASTFGTDITAGYDFGPKIVVPVRARFDLDDSVNVDSSGRIGVFGVGASVRLTTPVYAGIGASVYNINVRGDDAPSVSATGVGTNIFVGNKIFSLPGIGLAIEGAYKKIPSVHGVDPSSFSLGLRASL